MNCPSIRVLWILPYLPWPTSSGGKARQLHLLRALAQRGVRLTLLVQSKTPLTNDARRNLEPMLERLVVLPRRPARSLRTVLAAIFSPNPILASINGHSLEFSKTLACMLNEHWDVVQVEHSYTFQACEAPLNSHKQPFVLTEHNVESSLGAATYGRFPFWLKPLAWLDQRRYRRWERRVMGQAQRVIAVTEADARELGKVTQRSPMVVVNGVDCAAFSEVRPSANSRKVLFIGNYEYPPNVDAVQWLLNEIAPLVWRDAPETRIVICGHAMPEYWLRQWRDSRIEWRGFVEDLRQVQRECAVFIAPIRHGGGSKLKVLEALAAGLPLVSTCQAISGLELTPGSQYLGGETAQALANALITLVNQPDEAMRIGKSGRLYVQQHHDWSVPANTLLDLYQSIATEYKESLPCV